MKIGIQTIRDMLRIAFGPKDFVADSMLKMFMIVVSKAIKDAGTVRRMAMVSEEITASLIDDVKSTEKRQQERSNFAAAMEAFRLQPNEKDGAAH